MLHEVPMKSYSVTCTLTFCLLAQRKFLSKFTEMFIDRMP